MSGKKGAIEFYGKETVELAEKMFKDRFGENLFARGRNMWQQKKFLEKVSKLRKLNKKEFEKILLELSNYY